MNNKMDGEDNVIRLQWRRSQSIDAVERVARALCRYAGHDPNLMKPTRRIQPVLTQEAIEFESIVDEPAWVAYVDEAERFVAAFEAFSRS